MPLSPTKEVRENRVNELDIRFGLALFLRKINNRYPTTEFQNIGSIHEWQALIAREILSRYFVGPVSMGRCGVIESEVGNFIEKEIVPQIRKLTNGSDKELRYLMNKLLNSLAANLDVFCRKRLLGSPQSAQKIDCY
jgi:hypothetical protein